MMLAVLRHWQRRWHYRLGELIQFEIYSDHDSLKYLFTQKEPSQRILRLCEFMADFNFTEVRYVSGPDTVVPDFLSRPWVLEQGQDLAAIRPLHLLSSAPPVRHTSLHSLRQDPCSMVVVLLTWKDRAAVQQRGGACVLWNRGQWRFVGCTFRRWQSSGEHRRVLSSNGCSRRHYQSDHSGIRYISKCCRILESGAAQMTALFSVQRADQYLSRRACLQFCGPPQCRRH